MIKVAKFVRHIFFCFIYCSIANESFAISKAEDFFTSPDMLSAEMSPNGQLIATINGIADNQKLVLIDNRTKTERDLLKLVDFTEKKASLRGITWLDNRHIAVQFSEIIKGVEDLLDTRNVRYLLVIELPVKTTEKIAIYSVKTKGWLVNPLRQKAGVFLYAKSGIYSKIYKIQISKLNLHKQKLTKLMRKDGGQFIKSNEIASVKGYATRWFFDNEDKPKAVLNFAGLGELHLSNYSENTTNEDKSEGDTKDSKEGISSLKRWNFSDLEKEREKQGDEFSLIMPVAMGKDQNTFYCLDFEEEEERSVYKVNYQTNQQELVYEADSYKIVDLIISPESRTLIGVKVLKDAGIHSVFINDQKEVKSYSNSTNMLSEISSSSDGKVSLIYKESHNQPGRYLLRNNKNNKEHFVGSSFPQLVGQLKTQLVEKIIKVEELDIPYLLTLPKLKEQIPLPLVVVPHGGPIGIFDDRYFDLTTQYLAANGYAVLRVNFRGSSGHTDKLKIAGKRQWGKLMLEDIFQSTLDVIQRDDINQNRVCIFGMSYGGYASTMLTIKYPEVFKCAVNVAGVSDVNLYLNTPHRTDNQEKWLKENVGDTVNNYEELKLISPIFTVEQLTRPILIIHGENDQIVDVEHAYRLKLMLEKYNKPYEWHIFPKGTHSFGNSEDRVMLYSKAKKFIDNHIGNL